MKPVNDFRNWGAAHPKLLDFLRIALGLILIWKGIYFILNLGLLDTVLRDSGVEDTSLGLSISINLLAQLIIILNILGGICITFNWYTRMFCLFNLPVLFGAVIFVNMSRGAFRPHAEFWLSLFCLLAIVAILISRASEEVARHKHGKVA